MLNLFSIKMSSLFGDEIIHQDDSSPKVEYNVMKDLSAFHFGF